MKDQIGMISAISDLMAQETRIAQLKAALLEELFPINCIVDTPQGQGRVVAHTSQGFRTGWLRVKLFNDQFERMYRFDSLKPVEK